MEIGEGDICDGDGAGVASAMKACMCMLQQLFLTSAELECADELANRGTRPTRVFFDGKVSTPDMQSMK